MAQSSNELRNTLREAAAQYRRRPKAELSLDELTALYGYSKGAFVNLRKTLADFPAPSNKKGNAIFYPAFKAVKVLLDYVERKERATHEAASDFQRLVAPPQEEKADSRPPMTASEQLKAYELRQKLIDEELAHGTLHRADHCAATSDKVFSIISRTFGSGLADLLDPMGKWPAEVRDAVNGAGENATLQVFGLMKDMLTGKTGADADADQQHARPARAAKPRRSTRGPAKTRAV